MALDNVSKYGILFNPLRFLNQFILVVRNNPFIIWGVILIFGFMVVALGIEHLGLYMLRAELKVSRWRTCGATDQNEPRGGACGAYRVEMLPDTCGWGAKQPLLSRCLGRSMPHLALASLHSVVFVSQVGLSVAACHDMRADISCTSCVSPASKRRAC